jgi:hypothetical protein
VHRLPLRPTRNASEADIGVPLPDPMPSILAGMETYDSTIEMEELAHTFDVPLTRLEMFVREQVASQPV